MASARKARPRPRVYLDACAVQRPFDRLISAEERAEASGVLLLLSWSLSSRIELVQSSVLDYETITRVPVERRAWGMFARDRAGSSFRPDESQHVRARALEKRLGLGAFDALHVACAEALQATLVTVDRTFLARTTGASRLRVRVVDPVLAVGELRRVIGDEQGRFLSPTTSGSGRCMAIGMATAKVTITIDEEDLRKIRDLVETGKAASVAGFVQHAVTVALHDVAGWGALLAGALEQTGGPLKKHERAWADGILAGTPAKR